jgi:hypothetical protein
LLGVAEGVEERLSGEADRPDKQNRETAPCS